MVPGMCREQRDPNVRFAGVPCSGIRESNVEFVVVKRPMFTCSPQRGVFVRGFYSVVLDTFMTLSCCFQSGCDFEQNPLCVLCVNTRKMNSRGYTGGGNRGRKKRDIRVAKTAPIRMFPEGLKGTSRLTKGLKVRSTAFVSPEYHVGITVEC